MKQVLWAKYCKTQYCRTSILQNSIVKEMLWNSLSSI